jgi:hypothetical protein
MLRMSAITSLLGLTEPIFVPRYWNPPSLFDLARRTGFDIESLIFSFAIGGIGAVLYDALTKQGSAVVDPAERHHRRHRLHRVALLVPFLLFIPLYLLPWNPIYPSITCLAVGALASVLCRPDLLVRTAVGGMLFLGMYALFVASLRWSQPGYIERVWNLDELSGVMPVGIPLEELLFGLAFGMYWSGIYEHFTWRRSVRPDHRSPRNDDDPVGSRPG